MLAFDYLSYMYACAVMIVYHMIVYHCQFVLQQLLTLIKVSRKSSIDMGRNSTDSAKFCEIVETDHAAEFKNMEGIKKENQLYYKFCNVRNSFLRRRQRRISKKIAREGDLLDDIELGTN